MCRITLLFITVLLLAGNFRAEGKVLADTLNLPAAKPPKTPRFFSLNTTGGIVLPTNEFVNEGCLPFYGALALKYGIYSKGDSWEDIAYGMPYYGVGLYAAKFSKKHIGTPISLFVFQGGELAKLSSKWSLNYELNLGMSFNWDSYDRFDNPNNIALGSSVNAHVGANGYFKNKLSPNWDLHFGVGLTHFSNGTQQLPNKGLNLFAPFVELVYNLDPVPATDKKSEMMKPPPLEKRIDYDLMVTITSRQIVIDTTGTGLPSRLLDHNFKVFGLSYAAMFVNSYKYRWGPSLELVYDESSGVQAWRQMHPDDGLYYDRIKLGPFHKRLTMGLSLKGELTFQRISFFANIGYNFLHGNKYDYRVYQIIGAKAYVKDNIFGTFGIRAGRFSKAQYLYWSIGYTIPGKPLKKGKFLQYLLP